MEKIINQDEKSVNAAQINNVESNHYRPLEEQLEYIQGIPEQKNSERQDNEKNSLFTKRIKRGAWMLMAAGIVSIIIYGNLSTSKSVDTSDAAAQALEAHISTSLEIGTRIASKDEYLGGEDVTITHDSSDDTTTIWVWDYAAEDGDYVQVLVNGEALGEAFMIKNKPVSFTVPTVAEVQILGTRDGGGGITYAIHYGLNETTYFNGMDEGNGNLYTLVRE